LAIEKSATLEIYNSINISELDIGKYLWQKMIRGTEEISTNPNRRVQSFRIKKERKYDENRDYNRSNS
jgi:hypothetical protein